MGIETDQGTRVGLPRHRSKVQGVEAFLRAGDPQNVTVQRTWRRSRALATILNKSLLDLEVACERIAAAKEPDPQMNIEEAISHAAIHDPALNQGDRNYLREQLAAADGESAASQQSAGTGTAPAVAPPPHVTREMALAELQKSQPERNWSLGALGQWEQGEIDAAYWWALNSEAVPVPAHVEQVFFEELDLTVTGDVATLLSFPGIEIEVTPVAIDEWSDELFVEVVAWASALHLRQRGDGGEVGEMPATFVPSEGDFEDVLGLIGAEGGDRGVTRLLVLNHFHAEIPAVAFVFEALFELDHIQRVGHSELFTFKAAADAAAFERLHQVVGNLGRGLPALEGVDFQKLGDQGEESASAPFEGEGSGVPAGTEVPTINGEELTGRTGELREQLDQLEEAGPLDLEDQPDLALQLADQEQAAE
jgi:hypothetical protein